MHPHRGRSAGLPAAPGLDPLTAALHPPSPEELDTHGRRLLRFARASVNPAAGFAWLDDDGRPDLTRPVHAWVTTRMTHVFALAALRGDDDAAVVVEHGVASLQGPLRDKRFGGWFASVAPDGAAPVDDEKQAYAHAFVALAASSAAAAGAPGADELLADAVDVLDRHFLDAEGRVVEGYDRAFTQPEPYRGANSSMHAVEALLALGDVLGEPARHATALGIAEHLVHGVARTWSYRLPEHFSPSWQPLPEYNADRRDDPFRPYGSTPGHLLEWSRLLLHLEASLPDPPAWLVEDARALFEAAVRTGWHVDGAPGFVYTTDWHDRPVVRLRMHWVMAEAVAAAAALARRTGEERYARWHATWWAYAMERLVDRERGSWHHELDPANRPSATVWQGKPDVYHAYQATLLPQLGLAPSAAAALRASAT